MDVAAPPATCPHRVRTLRAALASGTLVLLALTACATGPLRVTTAPASGDGTLRVGLILDNTGRQDFLNTSQLAAARLAVKEINAAGGHNGRVVELLPENPGQDAAGQAKALVEAGADVVIGPTDSSRAPGAIAVLSQAKVAVISPANTATGLSTYDSGGYYFRTAAADVAQGPVLVKLARDGGARTIAVVREEGSYGKDVSGAVADAAARAGLEKVADAEFKPGQASPAAAAAKAANPDAVVLIAREGAQEALVELGKAGVAGSRLVLSDGAVNEYASSLARGALDGARGILPGTFPTMDFQARLVAVDPGLKDMVYAAETYDAVILAGVAAAAAGDDAGMSIAAKLVGVSGGAPSGKAPSAPDAVACTGYQECSEAIRAGKQPDYDGESGPVDFNPNGDVTAASYIVYRYGPDNLPVRSGSETAASS